jgi:hypothetical protein
MKFLAITLLIDGQNWQLVNQFSTVMEMCWRNVLKLNKRVS